MPQPGPHAEEEACGPGPRRPAGHAVLTHPAFAVARPGNKEVSFPTAGGHPAGGPGEPGHTRQSLAAGELRQDSGGVQRQGLWAPERPGAWPEGGRGLLAELERQDSAAACPLVGREEPDSSPLHRSRASPTFISICWFLFPLQTEYLSRSQLLARVARVENAF